MEINGSHSNPFPLGWSIRQGYPLAPALFLIVVEALFYILRDKMLSLEVRGLYLPNNDELIKNHFANDTALFLKLIDRNFKALQTKLDLFYTISSAHISQARSICLGWDEQPPN